jgi:hypothetical protein
MAGLASSTSFQAQAAHFRFSPDSGHIAASHRSATKSVDARRGAADGGELHQVAGAAAWVAADKRGVTRLQPHSSRQSAECPLKPPILRVSPQWESRQLAKHFRAADATRRDASEAARMAQARDQPRAHLSPGIGYGNAGLHARPGLSVVAARKPIAVPAMRQ